MSPTRAAAAGLIALSFAACSSRDRTPLALRLVDLYKPDVVEGRVQPESATPKVEWRFGTASGTETLGWKAGAGISDLAVRDGRLIGTATSVVPILDVELPDLPADVVHELQLRMRVSEGGEAAAVLRGAAPIDFAQEAELLPVFPWPLTSPLVPGDELQSSALRGAASVVTAGRKHLLLRPTDRPGARFEIESVRLVTRREHVRSVASGIGWQGLSEVYRETLVARAPETLRFRARLPSHPRLELAVGTVDDWPVRFRVIVKRSGGAERTLIERSVTVPNRWEPIVLDLGDEAGRDVELALALSSEKQGTLGFWGAPVVREVGTQARADRNGQALPQGVILIWADTLRRDHLDVYGYGRQTAPEIRRMATEGALFLDCVAQASWTKVSGPSILTSIYPTSHGVRDIADRLPSSALTIAEAYREAGWATLALASIPFVGKMTNLHQGFEEFHEATSMPDVFKTARPQMDRLAVWLEAHRDVPFFVLFHLRDPHSPYRPDPPYDALWADASRREEHERQQKAVRPFIVNPLLRRQGMPTREELVKAEIDPDAYVAYERDWYDGSIREMDAEIGRLRERLGELGLGKRVLVVLLSDHGTEFLDHGRMFHGQTVYSETSNVPLIFWGPGIVSPGAVVDGTVELVDVMPTLLELSGLRSPATAQGRSLVGLLGPGESRRRAEPRLAIAEKAARPGSTMPPHATSSFAVFSSPWKLIHNVQRSEGIPEYELYDRSADPVERDNLAAKHPDVVARLAKELQAWRTKAEAARLKPDSAAGVAISKEELERLRALGYVQ